MAIKYPRKAIRFIAYFCIGFFAVLAITIFSLFAPPALYMHAINPFLSGISAGWIGLLFIATSYVFLTIKGEEFIHKIFDHFFSVEEWRPSSNRLSAGTRKAWRVVCAVSVPLTIIAMPRFVSHTPEARAAAAKNSVATAVKECAVEKARGSKEPRFAIPKLSHYKVTPSSGNCAAGWDGLITAVSSDKKKYPDFSMSTSTYTKSCSHNGPNEELHGCSARVNGMW